MCPFISALILVAKFLALVFSLIIAFNTFFGENYPLVRRQRRIHFADFP